MTEQELRTQITSTGIELLDAGLLVRTWGNISARLDEEHMLITPSGRDYRSTEPEDLPKVRIDDLRWTGPFKPSSEKGIHAAAYQLFPEVNFVIHTHQAYASALAVYGLGQSDISPEEQRQAGEIAIADYGLPGTKTLREAVRTAMQSGAHTVLMRSHGVVIAGRNREEAVERALLLEKICRRNCRGIDPAQAAACIVPGRKEKLMHNLRYILPQTEAVDSAAVVLQAAEGHPIRAQLDDMAQMIGMQIPVARNLRDTIDHLKKYHAVLIPGVGAVVAGQDADDTEALKALVEKSAIAYRHTKASGVSVQLPRRDCLLMYAVYQKKYSRQKYDSGKGQEKGPEQKAD